MAIDIIDVASFLNAQDKKTLDLWGTDFFLDKLSRLEKHFKNLALSN